MNFKNPFKIEKPFEAIIPKDDFIQVIELIQTLNNRKMKHLHDCINAICKSAKVPYVAPTTFLTTDLEVRYFERMSGEKAELLKKLVLKSFDESEIEK